MTVRSLLRSLLLLLVALLLSPASSTVLVYDCVTSGHLDGVTENWAPEDLIVFNSTASTGLPCDINIVNAHVLGIRFYGNDLTLRSFVLRDSHIANPDFEWPALRFYNWTAPADADVSSGGSIISITGCRFESHVEIEPRRVGDSASISAAVTKLTLAHNVFVRMNRFDDPAGNKLPAFLRVSLDRMATHEPMSIVVEANVFETLMPAIWIQNLQNVTFIEIARCKITRGPVPESMKLLITTSMRARTVNIERIDFEEGLSFVGNNVVHNEFTISGARSLRIEECVFKNPYAEILLADNTMQLLRNFALSNDILYSDHHLFFARSTAAAAPAGTAGGRFIGNNNSFTSTGYATKLMPANLKYLDMPAFSVFVTNNDFFATPAAKIIIDKAGVLSVGDINDPNDPGFVRIRELVFTGNYARMSGLYNTETFICPLSDPSTLFSTLGSFYLIGFAALADAELVNITNNTIVVSDVRVGAMRFMSLMGIVSDQTTVVVNISRFIFARNLLRAENGIMTSVFGAALATGRQTPIGSFELEDNELVSEVQLRSHSVDKKSEKQQYDLCIFYMGLLPDGAVMPTTALLTLRGMPSRRFIVTGNTVRSKFLQPVDDGVLMMMIAFDMALPAPTSTPVTVVIENNHVFQSNVISPHAAEVGLADRALLGATAGLAVIGPGSNTPLHLTLARNVVDVVAQSAGFLIADSTRIASPVIIEENTVIARLPAEAMNQMRGTEPFTFPPASMRLAGIKEGRFIAGRWYPTVELMRGRNVLPIDGTFSATHAFLFSRNVLSVEPVPGAALEQVPLGVYSLVNISRSPAAVSSFSLQQNRITSRLGGSCSLVAVNAQRSIKVTAENNVVESLLPEESSPSTTSKNVKRVLAFAVSPPNDAPAIVKTLTLAKNAFILAASPGATFVPFSTRLGDPQTPPAPSTLTLRAPCSSLILNSSSGPQKQYNKRINQRFLVDVQPSLGDEPSPLLAATAPGVCDNTQTLTTRSRSSSTTHTLIPPPPFERPLVAKVGEAVIAVTLVSSIFAAVSSPALSFSVSRNSAMLNLLERAKNGHCQGIDETSADVPGSDSPTQLSIGDSIGRYYVGAAVGNFVLIVGLVAAVQLAGALYLRHQKSSSWTRPFSVFARCQVAMCLYVCLALLMCPSLTMALVVVTVSDVPLTQRIVAVIFALVILAVTVFYTVWALFIRERKEKYKKPLAANTGCLCTLFRYWFEGEGEWVMPSQRVEETKRKNAAAAATAREQHLEFDAANPQFDGFNQRAPWFSAVEFLVMIGLALSSFVTQFVEQDVSCVTYAVSQAVVLGAYLFCCLFWRPFQELLLRIMTPIMSACQLLVVVVIAAMAADGLPSWLDSFVLFIVSLQSVLGIFVVLSALGPLFGRMLRVFQSWRNASKRQRSGGGRGSGGDGTNNKTAFSLQQLLRDGDEEHVLLRGGGREHASSFSHSSNSNNPHRRRDDEGGRPRGHSSSSSSPSPRQHRPSSRPAEDASARPRRDDRRRHPREENSSNINSRSRSSRQEASSSRPSLSARPLSSTRRRFEEI